MKKNNAMRWAVVLLVLVLMTSCFVGATFAKYTSKASGSATATVAKWSFTVNGNEFATENATLTFSLFNTINDTGNTAAETDVADQKIAPGTAGSFALKIKNASEVNAKWTVTLVETNANNIPLQYSIDGTTWKDSVAELTAADLTDKTIAMNGETTVTVYWRWAFEGENGHAGQTDATDTALGVAARDTAANVTITATLTATQAD